MSWYNLLANVCRSQTGATGPVQFAPPRGSFKELALQTCVRPVATLTSRGSSSGRRTARPVLQRIEGMSYWNARRRR